MVHVFSCNFFMKLLYCTNSKARVTEAKCQKYDHNICLNEDLFVLL